MLNGNADISLNVAVLAVSARSSFMVVDLVKGPRIAMLHRKETKSSWFSGARYMSEQRELTVDI